MSYSDKLEELHRLRAEVRRLERQAEAEARPCGRIFGS